MRYFLFSCFCFFPLKPRRLPQLFYLSRGKVHVWRSSPVGEFLPLPRLTLRTRRSFTAPPLKKKNGHVDLRPYFSSTPSFTPLFCGLFHCLLLLQPCFFFFPEFCLSSVPVPLGPPLYNSLTHIYVDPTTEDVPDDAAVRPPVRWCCVSPLRSPTCDVLCCFIACVPRLFNGGSCRRGGAVDKGDDQ